MLTKPPIPYDLNVKALALEGPRRVHDCENQPNVRCELQWRVMRRDVTWWHDDMTARHSSHSSQVQPPHSVISNFRYEEGRLGSPRPPVTRIYKWTAPMYLDIFDVVVRGENIHYNFLQSCHFRIESHCWRGPASADAGSRDLEGVCGER